MTKACILHINVVHMCMIFKLFYFQVPPLFISNSGNPLCHCVARMLLCSATALWYYVESLALAWRWPITCLLSITPMPIAGTKGQKEICDCQIKSKSCGNVWQFSCNLRHQPQIKSSTLFVLIELTWSNVHMHCLKTTWTHNAWQLEQCKIPLLFKRSIEVWYDKVHLQVSFTDIGHSSLATPARQSHQFESWYTCEEVMTHICLSHGTHMNESWYTCE